jgi:hypothetical protein
LQSCWLGKMWHVDKKVSKCEILKQVFNVFEKWQNMRKYENNICKDPYFILVRIKQNQQKRKVNLLFSYCWSSQIQGSNISWLIILHSYLWNLWVKIFFFSNFNVGPKNKSQKLQYWLNTNLTYMRINRLFINNWMIQTRMSLDFIVLSFLRKG